MLRLKEILFSLLYFIIASLILAVGAINTINETNVYMDAIFSKMNLTIRETGSFNAHNAAEIQGLIDAGIIYDVLENDAISVNIYQYPERNEYGFNQGVFPETGSKGTLIGSGQPSDLVLANVGHFLILDRMWAFYDQGSIFNYHFLLNFKSDYLYLSNRVYNPNNQPLYSENYIDNRYLIEDIDNIELQKKNYGYFFTRPYFNIYTGERVISVISPIMEDGALVADLGINIELSKLTSTVSLFPKIKDKINLYINFTYDDNDYYLSHAKYNYWNIYNHTYEIKDLGIFVASYDVSLIVYENFALFLLLAFLYFLLLFNSRRFDREKREEIEIKHQLSLDVMTQLYNRRGLDEILDNELKIYRKKNQPISLLALDANKFKEINDTHGHQVGDNALIFIAKAINQCMSKHDFAIRMGGDEFLVILPNQTQAEAEEVATSIVDYLAMFAKPIVGLHVYVTTACTEFDSAESFDEAYMRVDEMMYEKKTAVKKKN